jgi:aminopeptidase N
LDVGVKAVQVYNDRFGGYPYTELDIVDAPMQNAGGVEFPGIVLIESSRYDDPENPVFINTVAHEVAHQWWYNVVGNDVIEEPWLDEGLTTYSAGVYYEAEYGSQGYQGIASYWQQSYDNVVQAGKDDQVTRSLTYFEQSSDPRVYGPVVYSKGALFFYNLRKEIGDRAFFEGLQTYYQQFQYQIATAKDLLKIFEAASGEKLDAFYQQWLYSP